jgi:cell division septation protein DedD
VKERLTGAIILVALLVLLVPELLTGPTPRAVADAAGTEGAPLRSYTIDLAEDGARQSASAGPTSQSSTVATDEPVAQAAAESEDEGDSEGGADPNASPSDASNADAATAAAADDSAATPEGGASSSAAGTSADAAGSAAEPEQPRSAFGPRAQATPGTARRAESGEASAARPAAESASSRRASAEPAARSESVNARESPRSASAGGWTIQLGVFANRENAERLAKQVKGKGYPVVVNETSGSGKRLYRVRVGPASDRAAANALNAKLRAAGHPGSVVAP